MKAKIVLTIALAFAFLSVGSVALGEYSPVYVSQWGTLGSSDGQLNNPTQVEADSFGSIYVGDAYNHRIQKFNLNGDFLLKWGSYHYSYTTGTFDKISGIGIDSQNNLYISDAGDARPRGQSFDNNGNFLNVFGNKERGLEEGKFAGRLADVSVDSNGNIYFLDRTQGREIGNYGVHIFSKDGNFLNRWGGFGEEELNTPYANTEIRNPKSIAIDSNNNVFVLDGNNLIKVFNKEGDLISFWGEGLFNRPVRLSIDKNDNVYVVDILRNNIQVFTNDGQHLLTFGSTGSGNGQFIYPTDIAFYDNNLLVADSGNNRIQKFSICIQDEWTCTEWSSCKKGVQARTCSKSFDCPLIETPKPIESEFCKPICSKIDLILEHRMDRPQFDHWSGLNGLLNACSKSKQD